MYTSEMTFLALHPWLDRRQIESSVQYCPVMVYYQPSHGVLSAQPWCTISPAMVYYQPSHGVLSAQPWCTIIIFSMHLQSFNIGLLNNSNLHYLIFLTSTIVNQISCIIGEDHYRSTLPHFLMFYLNYWN